MLTSTPKQKDAGYRSRFEYIQWHHLKRTKPWLRWLATLGNRFGLCFSFYAPKTRFANNCFAVGDFKKKSCLEAPSPHLSAVILHKRSSGVSSFASKPNNRNLGNIIERSFVKTKESVDSRRASIAGGRRRQESLDRGGCRRKEGRRRKMVCRRKQVCRRKMVRWWDNFVQMLLRPNLAAYAAYFGNKGTVR